jgi:glucokinase
LWGVLVSVPGIVDETNGTVLFSPNLHWLESVSLTALVQQVWDLPVALVQEIRALALGQVIADPGGPDFLLVDFGQGVGGAIVLDGRLYTHPTPLSGEVGHTPVPGNLRPCGCGAVGCLETLVSERGLLESFAAGTGEAATWARLVARLESHGVEPWLESSLAAAGKVISGALNVLGISRVLVSGLITQLPPAAAECLFAEIQRGAMWARFGKITCQVAEHHRGAGLVAAGLDRLMLPDNDSDPSARSVFATTNE